MKKLVLFYIITFFIISNLSAQQEILENCYAEHIQPLDSMIAKNTDFSDLAFLKNKLSDKRIVLLGEESHGDGASFEAKIRLIKFFVEEMGYTTLAFEGAPLLNMHFSGQRIKEGNTSSEEFRKSWYGLWAKSEQCQALYNYIDTRSDINLLGIECNYDNPYNRNLVELMQHYAGESVFKTINKERFSAQAKYFTMYAYDKKAQENIDFKYLNMCIKRFAKNANKLPEDQKDIILKNIDNYKQSLLYTKMMFGTYKEQNRSISMRDSCMASNIEWYLEHNPDEKIIIWAANFHTAKNLALANYKPGDMFYQEMEPLGHRLYSKYGNQVYAIAMTASDGYTGIFNYPQTEVSLDEETWEYQLSKQTKSDYAFVDFETIRTYKTCKNFNFYADLISKHQGQWFQIFDGVIYIRKMTPSTMSTM